VPSNLSNETSTTGMVAAARQALGRGCLKKKPAGATTMEQAIEHALRGELKANLIVIDVALRRPAGHLQKRAGRAVRQLAGADELAEGIRSRFCFDPKVARGIRVSRAASDLRRKFVLD